MDCPQHKKAVCSVLMVGKILWYYIRTFTKRRHVGVLIDDIIQNVQENI